MSTDSTASTFPLPYIWAEIVLHHKGVQFWDFVLNAQNSNSLIYTAG